MIVWSPRLRWAAVLLHLLLIGLMAWRASSILDIVVTLVLVLALPGLVRGRLRTYGWASMLVAFYAALWLANAYGAGSERPVALMIATVAALDFSAIVLFARLRRREP
jgi:uncharacterized membrane protein